MTSPQCRARHIAAQELTEAGQCKAAVGAFLNDAAGGHGAQHPLQRAGIGVQALGHLGGVHRCLR